MTNMGILTIGQSIDPAYQVFKIRNLEADFVVVLCCYFTSMVNI